VCAEIQGCDRPISPQALFTIRVAASIGDRLILDSNEKG
jgi:hypothetical protein